MEAARSWMQIEMGFLWFFAERRNLRLEIAQDFGFVTTISRIQNQSPVWSSSWSSFWPRPKGGARRLQKHLRTSAAPCPARARWRLLTGACTPQDHIISSLYSLSPLSSFLSAVSLPSISSFMHSASELLADIEHGAQRGRLPCGLLVQPFEEWPIKSDHGHGSHEMVKRKEERTRQTVQSRLRNEGMGCKLHGVLRDALHGTGQTMIREVSTGKGTKLNYTTVSIIGGVVWGRH